MTAVGVYDQIKSAFQDIIAPELHALRGDIRVLDQKIDGVDSRLTTKIAGLDQKLDGVDSRLITKIGGLSEKIDGVDSRLSARLDALGEKIDSLDSRVSTKIDSVRIEMLSLKGELIAEVRRLDARMDGVDRELRTAIDVRERLAALEARRAG